MLPRTLAGVWLSEKERPLQQCLPPTLPYSTIFKGDWYGISNIKPVSVSKEKELRGIRHPIFILRNCRQAPLEAFFAQDACLPFTASGLTRSPWSSLAASRNRSAVMVGTWVSSDGLRSLRPKLHQQLLQHRPVVQQKACLKSRLASKLIDIGMRARGQKAQESWTLLPSG